MPPSDSSSTGDVAVIVAERPSGHILLAKRSSDRLWEFPGGKIEPGETVAEAALRELGEETGLDGDVRFVADQPYQRQHNDTWTLHPVHIDVNSSDVHLSHEHTDHQWTQPRSIPEYNESLDLTSVIERIPTLGDRS